METSEKKVYITRNNANKILQFYAKELIKTIDKKAVLDAAPHIYKEDLSWILSTLEFKYLYIEKLVFSENETLRAAGRLIERVDSGFLFITKSPPKYHYDSRCKSLRSDYINFSIPPEIEAKGREHIERFRQFAEDNKSVFYENPNKFLDMLEANFLLRQRPERVEFVNSGSQEFVRLDIDELEKVIDEHLEKARRFQEENPATKNLRYAPARYIKNLDNSGVTAADRLWHEKYKTRLKAMLREYIRKANNPDFSYTKIFLDSLGFEECRACAKISFSI